MPTILTSQDISQDLKKLSGYEWMYIPPIGIWHFSLGDPHGKGPILAIHKSALVDTYDRLA